MHTPLLHHFNSSRSTKTVPAAKGAKPEQFIDTRFLDKLEKSGLLAELYR